MENKPLLTTEQHNTNNDYLLMLVPPLVIGAFMYGVRCLIMFALALLAAHVCDRMCAAMHGRAFDISDNSSLVIAGIITVMMPASVPYYVLLTGVLIALIIGKEAFGGYGNWPFNPAAVGYMFAALCWPDDVLRFPEPFSQLALWGKQTVPLVSGSSYKLKIGGLPNIGSLSLLLGDYAGPIGTTCLLVILACGIFLWARRRSALAVSVSFLLSCAVVAYCFPRLGEIGVSWPWVDVSARLSVLKYEMSSGMLVFASVFLVNEPCTTPKRHSTQALYGVLLGVLTMMYHYYGTYEIGVCFALIVLNTITPALERVADRIFGKKQEVTLYDK